MKKTLLTVVGTLVVLALLFLAFIYSGVYNVAASAGHTAPVRWALLTLQERSVEAHAGDVVAPALDSARAVAGAGEYDEMCVGCHGAPGVEQSWLGKGMEPEPPDLSETVGEWSDGELFWILDHGIKLAGMPGFGVTHADEDLWNTVAFLRRLPDLSPAEYRAWARLGRALEEGEHGEHEHGAAEGEETRMDGHGHDAEAEGEG